MAAPANEKICWSEVNEGEVLEDSGRLVDVDDVGGGHGDGGML